MEVSGRRGSPDIIRSCQPCKGDGDTVQAEGYCENCNEFICSSCIKAHRKLAGTKNHVIKSKDEMPTVLSTQSAPCTELCDVHMNEIVKFYCQDHDSVGCGDCMVLEHTSCKVQLVSDVSCNYDNGDDLVRIKHRIKHLQKNLDSCKQELKSSLITADEIKITILKEIKTFRKEMDNYLDRVEKDLIQEVEKISASDIAKQQTIQGRCVALNDEIEQFKRKKEQFADNINNLFVTSKQILKKLQRCNEINEEISSKSQITTLKFAPSKELKDLKMQNMCLGNLDRQVKKFSGRCRKSIVDRKTHFVKKIDIKTISGKKTKSENDCFITGMAIISEAEILLADSKNGSLKVLNHKEGKITSTLKLANWPADVTTINSSSAATTLPVKGKIMFINTQNGLSISHSLQVREGCCGIDHHNGIMALTFSKPAAVQVLDMEGHILHQVSDTSILGCPRCVSLSNNNESMYVSDWENNAVHQFTLTGHLKTTIKSKEMKYPYGLTVANCGNVVVCDADISDKIGVVVSGKSELLPLCVQNVLDPFSLLICEDQGKLFISEHRHSKECNYIKEYDLK
ncbi:uncharacterized protein LOC132734294 [Ruditapes philippinarum]|uniref:uncharacterized protein LOC132734294 n=1 Tax=Ruditapes philippinarum TaxID=129788 RepID=UPI00295B0B7C|nr:uncharacterized protein LOC132734294 [Ruditapes philippinarum]